MAQPVIETVDYIYGIRDKVGQTVTHLPRFPTGLGLQDYTGQQEHQWH